MPKFIGTITRDDASDFKLIEGSDVKIRGTKDLTGVTLVDTDLLLLDDVSVSSSDANGTEDSTGKITLSQLKTYIGARGIADNNLVEIDGADIADDEYARFTANGLESRTIGEIKSDLSLAKADVGLGNVTNDAQLPLAGGDMTGALKITKTAQQLALAYDGSNEVRFTTGSTGTLTILSVGSGTTNSDIVLDADGSVHLDSANGKFIAKHNGTEFSSTSSAYAGMIIGYTKIQNVTATNGYNTITISNSMAVLSTAQSTDLSIVFVAPPSGKVEINLNCLLSSVSKTTKFSLSSGSSYAEVAAIHTYDGSTVKQDESDNVMLNHKFVVTGLTPGASTTYYIAAQASSNSSYIYHGTDRTGGLYSPPIIITATALPTTITTGE